MAKKRKRECDENVLAALMKLKFPIYDKRHNLLVDLDNGRARSNESRFEHITRSYHKLTIEDIKTIPEGILNARLRKDSSRKNTYNYYYQRNGDKAHYIKISVIIKKGETRTAKIKTIFIVTVIK